MIQFTKTKGFTFIEVLVALVVVAVALTATTSAMTNTASNTSHLRDKIFAHWVADNRITDIRIGKLFPNTDNESSETVEMGNGEWTWKQKVEKTADDHIRRVTVYVYKGDSDEGKAVTFLSTLVLNPSQTF